MEKKEPTPVNINNNTNVVNVKVQHPRKPRAKKEKKTDWLVKAIVVGIIGLISAMIITYVNHSTAANGKPAFIQSDASNSSENK